jgi:DNA excision repair protein ERCC-1
MDDFDDSFDDLLANMEMPEVARRSETPASSSSSTVPAQPSTSTEVITEKPKYSNAVQVNPKQRGNPILKAITNIPWEFNDKIVPDYGESEFASILPMTLLD